MNVRILVCGDRNWSDSDAIYWVIKELVSQWGDDIAIIHGDARGADTFADRAARSLDLVTVAVPAKWAKHGKSAGPRRNEYMLNRCKPNLVLAFHADLENSKGTKHMVEIAGKAGVPVIVIKSYQEVEAIHDKLPKSLCPETVQGGTA